MKKHAIILLALVTSFMACKSEKRGRTKAVGGANPGADGTGDGSQGGSGGNTVSEEDKVIQKEGVIFILEKKEIRCQVIVEAVDETPYDVKDISVSQDKAFINVKFTWGAAGWEQEAGSVIPDVVGVFSEKLGKLAKILVDKTLLAKADEDVKIDKLSFQGTNKTKLVEILKDEKIMAIELGEFFDLTVAPKFTDKKRIRTCRE
jgi:hypothetical protein